MRYTVYMMLLAIELVVMVGVSYRLLRDGLSLEGLASVLIVAFILYMMYRLIRYGDF